MTRVDPELLAYLDENPEIAERIDAALGRLQLPIKYVPVSPTGKQEWFLLRDELEVFFGGAAGPGKSWGLLMAALQYVETPGYHALLLRPTLTEFEQQGGLIEVSHTWLGQTDAHWNGTKRQWAFPSGASVRFGYLRNEADLSHYPGGGVSMLGFDELTLFTERLYLGMFRLLRQPLVGPLENVPVRVRAASNPGKIGHGFVKGRFIDDDTREPGAVFVKATIHDNPHLDYDTYVNTVLVHMHPVDRLRLINGDWDVSEEGGKFKRQDFRLVDPGQAPAPLRLVRYWDLAATEPSETNTDPDWTCGLLMSLDEDQAFTIRDVILTREESGAIEKLVRATAEHDAEEWGGVGRVSVLVEQDPGQAGKAQINHFQRNVLSGFVCYPGSTRIRGKPASKVVRATAVSAAVANDLVRLARVGDYREALSQWAMFPNEGSHDDAVDALSGAHAHLTRSGTGTATITVPRARIPGVQPRAVPSSRRLYR